MCLALSFKACEYNGKVYKFGQTFRKGDGCNQCSCMAGGLTQCTNSPCYPGKQMIFSLSLSLSLSLSVSLSLSLSSLIYFCVVILFSQTASITDNYTVEEKSLIREIPATRVNVCLMGPSNVQRISVFQVHDNRNDIRRKRFNPNINLKIGKSRKKLSLIIKVNDLH